MARKAAVAVLIAVLISMSLFEVQPGGNTGKRQSHNAGLLLRCAHGWNLVGYNKG
nr:hypothetical protein [Thermococcus piezophilus]